MLYLDIDQDVNSAATSDPSSMDSTPTLTSVKSLSGASVGESSSLSITSRSSLTSRDVVADAVDQFLWNQDGKIPRQRNEQLYVSIVEYLF